MQFFFKITLFIIAFLFIMGTYSAFFSTLLSEFTPVFYRGEFGGIVVFIISFIATFFTAYGINTAYEKRCNN